MHAAVLPAGAADECGCVVPAERGGPWARAPAQNRPEQWYAALVRRATGLSTRPEEIHHSALAEVRRLRGELFALAQSGGFDGPVEQFMAEVRSNPACSSLDAAGVTTEFQTIMRAVERGLPRWPEPRRQKPS